MTTKMLLAEKIGKFNAKANEHLEKQSLNPFSGRFSRSPSPRLSKEEYGRPLPGSKTEQRGQKAKSHINKEILELCNCIHDVGVYNLEQRRKDPDFDAEEDDGTIIVTFGELFQIYTKINDKVVGLLIAAKKRGFVYFEKEILFQRRDDDVLIALVKPIHEIRGIMRESLTPSPMAPGCSSSRTPSPSRSRGNSEEPSGSGEEGTVSSEKEKAKTPTEEEGAGNADASANTEERSCPVKLEVTEADDSTSLGSVPESLPPLERVPADPVIVREEEGRGGETGVDQLEESQTNREEKEGVHDERHSTTGENDQGERDLKKEEQVDEGLEKGEQVAEGLVKDEQVAESLVEDGQVAESLVKDEQETESLVKDEQGTESLVKDEQGTEALVKDEQVAEALVKDEQVAEALAKDEQGTEDLQNDKKVAESLEKDEQVGEDAEKKDDLASSEKDVDEVGGSLVQEEISANEKLEDKESQGLVDPFPEVIQECVEVEQGSGEKLETLELHETITPESCLEVNSVETASSGEEMNNNGEHTEKKHVEIDEAVGGLTMTSPSDQPNGQFTNDEVPENATERAGFEENNQESLPHRFEGDEADEIPLETESKAIIIVQGDEETNSPEEPSIKKVIEETQLQTDCI